jgi:predicted GH43/DUF377 family glycosyl hydrolase
MLRFLLLTCLTTVCCQPLADANMTGPKTPYSSTPPAISRSSVEGDANYTAPTFPIGPFTKYENNPLLVPNPKNEFESAHIYNAASIVLDDKVFLLYRAQDPALKSSIGLAWSENGYDFTRLDHPIFEASEPWEEGGGVEDPRIVRIDGVFYMTYTAYDLNRARLCLATSEDLVNWTKYPPLFPDIIDVETNDKGRVQIRTGHSKSGAIFTEKNADGKYIMIFGDSALLIAESEDLINWTMKPFNDYFTRPVHPWESRLMESGPPPFKTKDGKWIMVYNSATSGSAGYRNNQYSIGQMLVDLKNITAGPIARLEKPSIEVSAENERVGLVNEVVFTEGMVQYKGQWFMYFGQADSELGVATAEAV